MYQKLTSLIIVCILGLAQVTIRDLKYMEGTGKQARFTYSGHSVSIYHLGVLRGADPQKAETLIRVKEEPIGTLHQNSERAVHPFWGRSEVVSKDGCHLAYVAIKEDKEFVVVDGRPGPKFDRVEAKSLVFSPDGSRFAYWAWVHKGEPCQVVVDEQASLAGSGLLWGPLFGPGGRRIAYCFAEDDHYRVVIDGHLSPKQDLDIQDPPKPVFSANGERFAYSGRRAKEQFMVIDGQAQPAYLIVADFCFSPDGKRTAYVGVLLGSDGRGKSYAVVDGQQGDEWDVISYGPVFTPDSKRVVFVGKRAKKYHLVVDGKAGVGYDYIGLTLAPSYVDASSGDTQRYPNYFIAFSPDGRRIAYTATKGDTRIVVVDEKPGPEHRFVWKPTFSADSTHFAYIAGDGPDRRVVIDGDADPPYPVIWEGPVFSTTGHLMAYRAGEILSQRVVVNGKEERAYDGIVCTILENPWEGALVLGPDGRRVAYVTKQDHAWFVIVDDKVGPAYETVDKKTLCFSPDGRRLGYAAKKNGKWFMVVDRHPEAPHDAILTPPFFTQDSKHVAYIIRDADNEAVVVDGHVGSKYDKVVRNGPRLDPNGSAEYLAVNGTTLYRVRQILEKL